MHYTLQEAWYALQWTTLIMGWPVMKRILHRLSGKSPNYLAYEEAVMQRRERRRKNDER